ncbi:MAG: aldehyde dehydrogenase, partial [Acidobacteriota bacterium]
MLHLPILRWGQPYRSVNQVVTPHFRTREPFVSMSQANLGLIRRDLLKQSDARAQLQKIPATELVAMAARAAEHFMNDALPLDPESGTMQTPQQYVEQVTATTG